MGSWEATQEICLIAIEQSATINEEAMTFATVMGVVLSAPSLAVAV